MFHAPFYQRAAVLAVALVVASAIDWRIRRERATRPRQALFLAASGLAGALFGAAHDAVTSSVSPDYFAVLKGLGSENLRTRAILLGAKAGASAGVVLACFVGYVLGRKTEGGMPRWRRLLASWWWTAAGAAAASSVVGLLAWHLIDPAWTADELGSLSADEGRRLVTVWAVHWATYGGAALGALAFLFFRQRAAT